MACIFTDQRKRCAFLRIFKSDVPGHRSAMQSNTNEGISHRAQFPEFLADAPPHSLNLEKVNQSILDFDSRQHHYKVPQMTIQSDVRFGDHQRVEMRYRKAVLQLERCLRTHHIGSDIAKWRGLIETGENNQVQLLRQKVNEIVEQRQSSPQHRNILETVFRALLPFSRNFFGIVVQAQPVPHSTPRILTLDELPIRLGFRRAFVFDICFPCN